MYWLQSQETLFNERKLKPDYKDIQKFLLYFAEILNIGVELGLISLEQQIKISELISIAIDRTIANYINSIDEFIGTSDQIANSFYVLTLWLENYSNYDNWNRLHTLRKVDDAVELLNESKKWFLSQVDEIMLELKDNNDIQNKLGIYHDIYKELKNSAYALYSYDNPYSDVKLKELHSTGLIGQSHFYSFLNDSDIDKSHNYLDKLKLQVKYFVLESSILVKIDAKTLFEKKRDELDLYSISQSSQLEELDDLMTKRKQKLYKKFVKDLQTTDDEVALRRKYNKSVQRLEHEWEERVKVLENQQAEADFSVLSVSSDFFTLHDFMNEYAVYKLADEEKIYYPSSIEERSKLISNIKTKDAVRIFLNNYKSILSSEEIAYVSRKL